MPKIQRNTNKKRARLLVCGDRKWDDGDLIFAVLKYLHTNGAIDCVIEGECRGADLLAREAAEGLGIPVLPFPADWDAHGKSAGPIRNRQMIVEGKPTEVMAFHDDLENSKGTANMLKQAKDAGLPVIIVSHVGVAYPPSNSGCSLLSTCNLSGFNYDNAE